MRALLLSIFDCRLNLAKWKCSLASAVQSRIGNWQSATLTPSPQPSPRGRGNNEQSGVKPPHTNSLRRQ